MILINAKSYEKEKKEGKHKSGFVFSRKVIMNKLQMCVCECVFGEEMQ